MKQKKMTGFVGMLILFMAILHGMILALASQGQVKDEKQWRESIVQHRQQKDSEFKTSSTSPMAAVKRLVIKPGPKTFVIESKGRISLSQQQEPGVQFSFINQKGHWLWEQLSPGVIGKAANKSVTPGSSLNQRTLFRGGKWTIAAYPSKDSLVMLVFDPRRPEIKHFSHLLYFPPDLKYAVPAILKKLPKSVKMKMLTSRNLEKTFFRYATIHFKLANKELRLTAFKYALQGDDSDILFIPFGDKTNDKETYGSGRFLEIHEPGETNFILDFNLCFNPLCNYSADAYNCPLPPFENILDVHIYAGEKTYPH
jgi:uncharacterized protein (DUF1684 family)